MYRRDRNQPPVPSEATYWPSDSSSEIRNTYGHTVNQSMGAPTLGEGDIGTNNVYMPNLPPATESFVETSAYPERPSDAFIERRYDTSNTLGAPSMNQPASEITYPNEIYGGSPYPGSTPYQQVHDTTWYQLDPGYQASVGADGILQGQHYLLQNPSPYLTNQYADPTLISDLGTRYGPHPPNEVAQRANPPISGTHHRPPSFSTSEPAPMWNLASNPPSGSPGPHQGPEFDQNTPVAPISSYGSSQPLSAFPPPSSTHYTTHHTHRRSYEDMAQWSAPETAQTPVGTEITPSASFAASPQAHQYMDTRKPWQLQRHGTVPIPTPYTSATNMRSLVPPSTAAALNSSSTASNHSRPPQLQSHLPLTFQPRKEQSATLISPYPPIYDFDYYGPASPASSYARVNTQLYSLAHIQDLPVKNTEQAKPVTSRSSPDLHQLRPQIGPLTTPNTTHTVVQHCSTTNQTHPKKTPKPASSSSSTGPTQFQFHHSSYMTLVPSPPSSSSNPVNNSSTNSSSATTTPTDSSPRNKSKQTSQNTQASSHHTGHTSKLTSKYSPTSTSPDNPGPYTHATVMQYGELASIEAILPNKKPKLAETQTDDLFASSTSSTGSQTVSPQMWTSENPEETSSDTTSYWTPNKD